jgi:hypothetical protein
MARMKFFGEMSTMPNGRQDMARYGEIVNIVIQLAKNSGVRTPCKKHDENVFKFPNKSITTMKIKKFCEILRNIVFTQRNVCFTSAKKCSVHADVAQSPLFCFFRRMWVVGGTNIFLSIQRDILEIFY